MSTERPEIRVSLAFLESIADSLGDALDIIDIAYNDCESAGCGDDTLRWMDRTAGQAIQLRREIARRIAIAQQQHAEGDDA